MDRLFHGAEDSELCTVIVPLSVLFLVGARAVQASPALHHAGFRGELVTLLGHTVYTLFTVTGYLRTTFDTVSKRASHGDSPGMEVHLHSCFLVR